jgi:hypothetical protein
MASSPGDLALLPCPTCSDLLFWTPAHAGTRAGEYRCVNGHSNPPCVVCGSHHTEVNRDSLTGAVIVLCSDCGQRSGSKLTPTVAAAHRTTQ